MMSLSLDFEFPRSVFGREDREDLDAIQLLW
jgi:hypothetical protein